uniref:3-keto-disaccharide hydrolase n=1 Tax=uncultured Draconibacterium sp. TaxID=1573823 RepID=UPI0032161F31
MKTKKLNFLILALFVFVSVVNAQTGKWEPLFNDDLSNAIFPEGIWTVADGVFTASEDQCIFTKKDFDDFELNLEFKTAEGTNSGVIVYCTDYKDWIPNSVEIQIADDHAVKWADANKTYQCAAIFGHLAATESRVKKPGEWNKMIVTCRDKNITVELNGKVVTEMDMALWTSGKKNPDGSDIPSWLPKPFAELPTNGKIGLQGKHAGAPIWFRNVKVREL